MRAARGLEGCPTSTDLKARRGYQDPQEGCGVVAFKARALEVKLRLGIRTEKMLEAP
jgi:hypothetical protein